MIKAILLDMGGVLLDLDHEGCVEKFRTECGFEDIDNYLHTTHHKGFISDLEAGMIGREEFFAEARKHCRPGTTDSQIEKSFNSLVTGMPPEKAEYLKRLSRRYPLYMVSNNNAIMMVHNSGLFDKAGVPLKDHFKDLILSHELHIQKPDREFYLEAVRRTGLEPEELLFVDDSQINVDAAKACGMKAVPYILGTSLEQTIEQALAQ